MRSPTRQDCIATINRAAARPTNKQLQQEAREAKRILKALDEKENK